MRKFDLALCMLLCTTPLINAQMMPETPGRGTTLERDGLRLTSLRIAATLTVHLLSAGCRKPAPRKGSPPDASPTATASGKDGAPSDAMNPATTPTSVTRAHIKRGSRRLQRMGTRSGGLGP